MTPTNNKQILCAILFILCILSTGVVLSDDCEGTDMRKYKICYVGGFHGWCEK